MLTLHNIFWSPCVSSEVTGWQQWEASLPPHRAGHNKTNFKKYFKAFSFIQLGPIDYSAVSSWGMIMVQSTFKLCSDATSNARVRITWNLRGICCFQRRTYGYISTDNEQPPSRWTTLLSAFSIGGKILARSRMKYVTLNLESLCSIVVVSTEYSTARRQLAQVYCWKSLLAGQIHRKLISNEWVNATYPTFTDNGSVLII